MWDRVQKKLRATVGEDIYASWFKSMTFEEVNEQGAHFSVPTQFLQRWIEQHYRETLLDLLKQEEEDISAIHMRVRGAVRNTVRVNPAKKDDAKKAIAAPSMNRMEDVVAQRMSDLQGPFGGAPLDPKYIFANFCQGEGNSFAFSAAKSVATGDRSMTFNPLYIHASVGLGKTHLLQAIAWESQRSRLPRKVFYFTCEKFMQRMRDAFAAKNIGELKDYLREADVLIIDDIQFLAGEKFLAEFSHLINALIADNKQVILSADRPVSDLAHLDERALSRIRGGIAIQLQQPDADLRKKILTTRLSAMKTADSAIDVSDAIIEYVTQSVQTNGRDLEGALNRLVAQQCYSGSPVTLESAQLVLKDLIGKTEQRKVMIEDIQRLVANHFNITKGDLVSQRRTRAIVRPRQIAMYLCKTMTPRSLPEIGKRFGNRDHTTVIHAVQKVEQLMSDDRTFSDDVELLRRLLND